MSQRQTYDFPRDDFFLEEFGKLANFCPENPYGLAVLDRLLKYRVVNETMGRLNGRSIEDHIGRSVQEVNAGVSSALGPIVQHVLEEGKPLVDLEVAVP